MYEGRSFCQVFLFVEYCTRVSCWNGLDNKYFAAHNLASSGHRSRKLSMTLNSPVAGGSLLAAIGVAVWRGFFWSYLRRKSLRCTFDENTHLELRTAVWAYALPFCFLGIGAYFGWEALKERDIGVFAFDLVLSLFMIGAGAYVTRDFLRARMTVTADRLIYKGEGKTWKIEASEVLRVKPLAYNYLSIHLRWDKRVSIPVTFHRSELILAFLRQAIIKNQQADIAAKDR